MSAAVVDINTLSLVYRVDDVLMINIQGIIKFGFIVRV